MDQIRLALKNIIRKKQRSFITILGIAIGMCSVVLVSAIGDAGKSLITSELSGFGSGSLAVCVDQATGGVPITNEDLDTIRSVDEVTKVQPMMVEYTYVTANSAVNGGVVWGVGADEQTMMQTELVYGRRLETTDHAQAAKVCLVEESFAEKSLGRINAVGKTISIRFAGREEIFQVVGVVRSGGSMMQNLMTQYVPSFFYMPSETIQELTGSNVYSQVWVDVTKDSDKQKVSQKILRTLTAQTNGSFYIQDIDEQKESVGKILSIITTVLSCVAGVSLVVAGLSIMTVMLVSVNERVREIGIKKSIGASSGSILFEFFIEALTLSFFGGVIGCSIGVLLSVVGCIMVGIAPSVNIALIIFCILFSVALGALFGIYPAKKAAGLNPADALRKE